MTDQASGPCNDPEAGAEGVITTTSAWRVKVISVDMQVFKHWAMSKFNALVDKENNKPVVRFCHSPMPQLTWLLVPFKSFVGDETRPVPNHVKIQLASLCALVVLVHPYQHTSGMALVLYILVVLLALATRLSWASCLVLIAVLWRHRYGRVSYLDREESADIEPSVS